MMENNNGRHRRDIDLLLSKNDLIALITMISLFFLIFTVTSAATIVGPGEVAIVVTLGKVSILPPGLHIRSPYISSVRKMSTKTQLLEQANTIPTKEGLSVRLETAM